MICDRVLLHVRSRKTARLQFKVQMVIIIFFAFILGRLASVLPVTKLVKGVYVRVRVWYLWYHFLANPPNHVPRDRDGPNKQEQADQKDRWIKGKKK